MPFRKLTLQAVVDGAVAMADRDGIAKLTMRALARELGVEAMSIYHHVDGKEGLLDAMVDRVYAEIDPPAPDRDWRQEMRRRSASVRAALHRHPWALPLMESRRAPGPASLAYHDANIACLRAAGMSPAEVAQAYAVIDAFVYGFVLQELMLPFDSGEQAAEMVSGEPYGPVLGDYPHMVWFAQEVVMAPGYSFEREFAPGLDLVLAGLPDRDRQGAQPC